MSTRLRGRARWWSDGLTMAVIGVLAACCYFWTSTSNAPLPRPPGPEPDYYNMLVRGIRAGHLYMDAVPDPALLALPADKRPGTAPYLLDASLHGGHYYLYFGVTPALTLFLPYALLTGRELPVELAVAAQATLGCWIALLLLLIVRREFFPDANRAALIVAGLALAFATAVPVTLRKSEVYEAACTSGFLWSMALFLFVTLAILRPPRRALWLGCASLSFGLAVGSRPNLLVGAGALGMAALWLWWRAEPAQRPVRWRWLAAAILPAAACGTALAIYNFARFGDPLEFGHRFQVGSIADNYISLRYFVHNLTVYYLTRPSVSWFFPFFSPGHEGSRPTAYMGIEHIHGAWLFLPWLFALPVLGRIFWQRILRVERLAIIAGVLAVWFAANFALIASISARANRYMLDFHPALVLLAGMALLAWSGRRGAWRWATGAGLATLIGSAVFGVMISFQVHNFFRLNNPVAFAAIERKVNGLVWPVHRATSPAFGVLAMDVTFPNAPAGQREPLLSTGAPLLSNTLTVLTLGPGRARLMFDHEGEGGATGPDFGFTPGRAHELKIWLGSLVPPAGHPWFADADVAAVQSQKQNVVVQLDGRTIFYSGAIPHDASPGQVKLGERSVHYSDEQPRFSGRIARVRRLFEPAPLPGPVATEEPLVYGLRVLLPRDRFGVAEPLLATGARGRGDVLLVEYSSPDTIRFGHDQIGGGIEWSETVQVNYAEAQSLEFAFEPVDVVDPFVGHGAMALRPIVRLGGREVLRGKTAHHPFVATQVLAGCNAVRASSCRLYFGGTILAWEFIGDGLRRVAAGPDGWAGTRAEFALPAKLAAPAEPLLAYRNRAGAIGVLAVRAAGAGGIQLGWIEPASSVWSETIPAAPATRVQLEANWRATTTARAAATAPVSAEDFMRGRVGFRWNGVDVFQPRLAFFESPIIATAGWRSAFESPGVVGARFTGAFARASDHSPPALVAKRASASVPRAVRMVVRFPTDRAGVCEPLLTTGRTGAADSVFVRYGAPGRVSLGFDHWGAGGPESAPFEIEVTKPHEIELRLGEGPWESGGVGVVSVRIDGRTVIEAPAKFHAARAGEIWFGENPVGLSTSVREFSGVLISLEGR